MRGVYRTVAGRIRQELEELGRVVERTERIWQQATKSADDLYLDAVALNLHGFYTGLERLFEVIASSVDGSGFTGGDWHQALLRQMTAEIPGARPAVLSTETRDRLDRYRGFRHVVRHVYTYNLDAEQIAVLVGQLRPALEGVFRELLAFADFLERLACSGREEGSEGPFHFGSGSSGLGRM